MSCTRDRGGPRGTAFHATCAVLAALAILPATAARAERPADLSAQTIKLPSGATSQKGLGDAFAADASTGMGKVSVPLALPPGRNAPALALEYSAGKGKGPYGVSFSLPVLHIYRSRDKGAPAWNEQDRFAVSGPGLNDELVQVDATRRHYRLKNEDSFVRFIRHSTGGANGWTIEYPNGKRAFLGTTGSSRQAAASNVYRWYVEREEDAFGIPILYIYRTDLGQLYLQEIQYQNQIAGSAFRNVVRFELGSRPDVFTDYSYGAAVTTALRVDRIDVSHGTRLMRRYRLSYASDQLNSLLVRIDMNGEGDTLPMPPLTFEYVDMSHESGRLVRMRSSPPVQDLVTGLASFEDVNADGLPDILRGAAGAYTWYENIDGVSWATARNLARSPDRALNDPGVVMLDVDGDGKRDVTRPSGDGDIAYFPAGNIWNGVFDGYLPIDTIEATSIGLNFADPSVRVVDLNSDGRTDFLYQVAGTSGDRLVTNRFDDQLIGSTIPELPIDLPLSDARISLMDFNGDGELDLVRSLIDYTSASIRVWFGLGAGRFSSGVDWGNVPRGEPTATHLADVNHDGQTDLVYVSGDRAMYYLNDGARFTTAVGRFQALPSTGEALKVLFADMNGNGTADIVWLTNRGDLYYLEITRTPSASLLARMDNGMGAVTEIAYRAATEYAIEAKRTGTPWKHPMPLPLSVISEIATSDSFGEAGLPESGSRITYEYHDPYYDGREKEFRGFSRVAVTEHGDDSHETLTTESLFHVGRDALTGNDEEVLKGKPYQVRKLGANGELYESMETRWERRWLCQSGSTVQSCTRTTSWSCANEPATVAETILPNCTAISNPDGSKDSLIAMAFATQSLRGVWEKTATPAWIGERTTYDAWGKATQVEKFGRVTFAVARTVGSAFDLAGATTSFGSDELTEQTRYINDVSRWMIGFPFEQSRLTGGSQVIERTRIHYDGAAFIGLPLGQIDDGNVTRELSWLNTVTGCATPSETASCWVPTKRVEYATSTRGCGASSTYAVGLPIAFLDANDSRSELCYDAATGMFPEVERVEVERGWLSTNATYDTGTGQLQTVSDMNGRVTRYDFDELMRLTAVADPDGSLSTPLIRYVYDSPTSPVTRVQIQNLVDRAGVYRTSYQYSDGFGRTRLVKADAESPHGYVASGWKEYSPRGAEIAVYDQFASSSPAMEAAGDRPATVQRLDAMNRPVRSTLPPRTSGDPVAYVERLYTPLQIEELNERDTADREVNPMAAVYPAIIQADGFGRARRVQKSNTNAAGSRVELIWEYDYDPLDRLSLVRNPGWIAGATQARFEQRFGYDSMGRTTSVVDPNFGALSYRYDGVGNVRFRNDALLQEQEWMYGRQSRVRSHVLRGDADGDPDVQYDFYYDDPKVGGPIANTANLLGRVSWVGFPTGETHFSYDSRGRETMQAQVLWDPEVSSFAAQTRNNFFRSTSYDPQGRITGRTFPGGMRQELSYNERSLVSQVRAGFGTGSLPTVFSGIAYDHRESPVGATARNGVRSCHSYNDRGQLTATLVGVNANCAQTGITANTGFQHFRLARTPEGEISRIEDLSVDPANNPIPRLTVDYAYDRLGQLTSATLPPSASMPAGTTFGFEYDNRQNLTRRTTNLSSAGFPVGAYSYGGGGEGPNMLTNAAGTALSYDAVGNLESYNGFALNFDPEGQLRVADPAGSRLIEYHYDAFGVRRITLTNDGTPFPRAEREIFDEFQIRDGEWVWLIEGGGIEAEVTQSQGLLIDLALLDQLEVYVDPAVPGPKPKPLPAEYMNLDGVAGDFNSGDLAVASNSYWNQVRVGGAREVWRYSHTDHITSTTHVTDSAGALVSFHEYRPYGQRSARFGMLSTNMFAGATAEATEDLGLVRFGERFYAPAIGRFISADFAIGESPRDVLEKPLDASLYSYAHNNPINYVDPEGTSPISVFAKLAIKQGAKKAIKELVETQLKAKMKSLAKKELKELASDLSDILDALEDPWYMTAIEMIPVAGDAVGIVRGSKQLSEAWEKYRKLEQKVERMAGARERAEAAQRAVRRTTRNDGPEHHLMTNKNWKSTARGGPWSPRFDDMARRAGMTLDDLQNRVRVPGHRGPHPREYHQTVFDRLQKATEGLDGDAYAAAFKKELVKIKREAARSGSPLNKLLRKPE